MKLFQKSMSKEKSIALTKWDSTGNTFLILRGDKVPLSRRKAFAKTFCDSRTGLAADGCLYLIPGKSPINLIWDFYNKDGSMAEMCGNAARAADQYSRDFWGLKTKVISFSTKAGVIETKNEKKKISVEMPKAQFLSFNKSVVFVNTGVPHAVWFVKSLKEAQKKIKTIQSLRHFKEGSKNGYNVTLIQEKKRNQIQAMTFERGVEGFTLSCGTGAVAAAIAYRHRNLKEVEKTQFKVKVQMPGGDLWVSKKNSEIYLTGGTYLVCKAVVNL